MGIFTPIVKEIKMKVLIEIEQDLVKFFRDNVDDTQPLDVLLVQMLKLLRELLTIANKGK